MKRFNLYVVNLMFGPVESENGDTVIPEDSSLQKADAHGGSAEKGMKHVCLHSHSCLPPAVMWHVTHRMSVIFLVLLCACSSTPITAGKKRT